MALRTLTNTLLLLLAALPLTTAYPQSQSDRPIDQEDINTILMQSTFKIEGPNGQGQSVQGTAFIVARPIPDHPLTALYVLVTAAHVLEDMPSDNAILQLRRRANGGWVRIPMPIRIRANGQPLWRKHPQADVAVMYVPVPGDAGLEMASTDLLASDADLAKFEIHPGDELECLGYPLGLEANDAGFPVLRSGTIASYPLLPTATTKSFLFDFRIFKGNSGGPVYFTDRNRYYGNTTHLGETIRLLVGLVSQESVMPEHIIGPYSEELRQLQLGLAVVIHASLIKQAIELLPAPTLPPK
jgi:hypothetical protein